jgi:hypothetical protein
MCSITADMRQSMLQADPHTPLKIFLALNDNFNMWYSSFMVPFLKSGANLKDVVSSNLVNSYREFFIESESVITKKVIAQLH